MCELKYLGNRPETEFAVKIMKEFKKSSFSKTNTWKKSDKALPQIYQYML